MDERIGWGEYQIGQCHGSRRDESNPTTHGGNGRRSNTQEEQTEKPETMKLCAHDGERLF